MPNLLTLEKDNMCMKHFQIIAFYHFNIDRVKELNKSKIEKSKIG